MTDTANQVLWRWDHGEPFGNSPENSNPSGLGTFGINYRFPGQYLDRASNTHYNYFRDYGPAEGRYIQSDPIGLLGNINTYAYVGGNPVSSDDPTGLLSAPAAGAIVGAVLGGIAGGVGAMQTSNATAGQIAFGTIAGALVGAGIGGTAGAVGSNPLGLFVLTRFGIGFITNLQGQTIVGNWGDPCFRLNVWGAVGAGVSAASFGTLNAATVSALGIASVGGRIVVGTPLAVSQGAATAAIGAQTQPLPPCGCR